MDYLPSKKVEIELEKGTDPNLLKFALDIFLLRFPGFSGSYTTAQYFADFFFKTTVTKGKIFIVGFSYCINFS